MSDDEFTCPKCGGHNFGRETKEVEGIVKPSRIVECHGDTRAHPPRRCDWRGEWPDPQKDAT